MIRLVMVFGIVLNLYTVYEINEGKYYFKKIFNNLKSMKKDYNELIELFITNKKHKTRLVRTELQRYTKKDENE